MRWGPRPNSVRVPGVLTEIEPPEEPPIHLTAPGDLLAGYLDFYRDAVLRKVDGLSEEDLRRSQVPSGWTPLELLLHLAHVERRWLQWGFAAEPVDRPWGDRDPDRDRWHVPAEQSAEQVRTFFLTQCQRSREIVADAELTDLARLGGRFTSEGDRPTLVWILFHVLQEYARHAGHLDVARELADGRIGE